METVGPISYGIEVKLLRVKKYETGTALSRLDSEMNLPPWVYYTCDGAICQDRLKRGASSSYSQPLPRRTTSNASLMNVSIKAM